MTSVTRLAPPVVLAIFAFTWNPIAARAQVIGPLTGKVGTTEPEEASFRLGPVLVDTVLTAQHVGVDTNVFDDPEHPKRDWHALITPGATMYVRGGLTRFTVESLTDFSYYRTYASERGINQTLRGRLDLLLTRVRPFVGGAAIDTRERSNAEIDLRAKRREREMLGGVSVELSPVTSAFAGLTRTEYAFDEDEVYRGVELAGQLNRREDAVMLGVRRELTPLTTLQVAGRMSRDRFAHTALRDSESRLVEALLTFAPDALFHGELSAGFQSFDPVDAAVDSYRGLTLGGRIVWPVLSATQLEIALDRRVQYSYEEAERYYIDTGTSVMVTQGVIGNFDVRARAGYRRLAYGKLNVSTAVDPDDRVLSALAGAGYTLGDESRIGINYEFTDRQSDRRRDRLFDRHRLYGSWAYKF